jgi:hypothetical protein
MGGAKAANAACHSNYSGSHWANTSEIIRLGSSYPWTATAWLAQMTGDITTDCYHWQNADVSRTGAVVSASTFEPLACNGAYKLACVY